MGRLAANTSPGPKHPLVPVLAAVGAAVGFTAALGPAIVHPANIDWLMRGDFSVHFLGWHLYRTGPWTLPFGATPHLLWPIGSSVALTDSIPLAAFVFKLLDPLLPPVFQYIGLWLVACHALQGVFGALLMQLATPRPALQFLGALLFILSPPLIVRLGHPALSAHWVLLAALWLSLKPGTEQPSRRRALAWALLTGVTAAIHPYLLLMVMALMAAAYLRQLVHAPARLVPIASHVALGLAAGLGILWQAGSFMVPADGGLISGGFGEFSANLLTFVLPAVGQSRFWPGPIQYASVMQGEGYAYLGAGLLLLAGVAAALAVVRGPIRWTAAVRRQWPLVLALLVLAALAVGPIVTAGPHTLFTYDARWWGPLAIFRANGRMIWPLYYALVVATIFAIVRLRHTMALSLLLAAVLLQAIDLAGMSRFVGDFRIWGFRDPLVSRFWAVALPHYERLVLVPPNVCDRDGAVDHEPFALLAGQYRVAINAGSTARYDVRRARRYCETLRQEMRDGLWNDQSLYVVRPDLLPTVAPPDRPAGPVCGVVDGFGVCVSRASHARWRNEFELR